MLQLNQFEFHILHRDAPYFLNMLKGFGANIHIHTQNNAIDFSDFGYTTTLISAIGKPMWTLLPLVPDFR